MRMVETRASSTRVAAAAGMTLMALAGCVGQPADKETSSSAPASSSTLAPTTAKPKPTTTASTTSTSTTTTTTLPPRPVVSSTEALLVSDPPANLPSRPVDVVVKPDGPVAHMGINTLVDGKWTANIYSVAGVEVSATAQLTVDGAVESQVADLAASAGMVVASGSSLTAAGEARGVLWSSPDGAQFPPGEILPSPITTAVGVALRGDDVPVVVGWSYEPRPSQLIVARRDAGGAWATTVLVADAHGYAVNGVAAAGQTVVITGKYDRGLAGSAGVIWASTDGGVTFQQLSVGLEEYASIGAPLTVGTAFVAMTEGRLNAPTKLLTSADGVGWASIGLSLASSDSALDTSPVNTGLIAVAGDKLIVSVSDLLSDVAVFGFDGRGAIEKAIHSDQTTVYFDALPYVLAGQPYIVSRSAGGFILSTVGPSPSIGHRQTVGPVARRTTLSSLGNGVAARSGVFPVTEVFPSGAVSWRIQGTWNVKGDPGWVKADAAVIPADVTTLASNGALDLMLSVVHNDPADSGGDGPIGGTAASVRPSTDTVWPAPQLIASGPGSEGLYDATGFQGGFIAVGGASGRSDNGDYTVSPLIAEYANGAWTSVPPPAGTPPQTELDQVYTSPDGDVLAIGRSDSEGANGDLLFTRDGAGAWSLMPSPFTGQSIDIVDVASTPTAIVLLVHQDTSWLQYTFDAGVFTSAPINFDGADEVAPASLVEVAGTKYLVGAAHGNLGPHLAVWRLDGEQAITVEWSDRVTSLDLRVDDVVVQDTHILVSGSSRGQNLTWDLTINTV